MNLFTKTISYIKASRQEMKKVTWPTKKETMKYSIAVVAISLVVMMYLYGLDLIFSFLMNFVV